MIKKLLLCLGFVASIAFFCNIDASPIPHEPPEDLSKSLGSLTLSYDTSGDEDLSPFEWQNKKHYEAVLKTIQAFAERELEHVLVQLIHTINQEDDFFNDRYDSLLSKNKERLVEWLKEDVLTTSHFEKDTGMRKAFPHQTYENTFSDLSSDDDSFENAYEDTFSDPSSDDDSCENARDRGIRRGYEQSSSDSEANSDDDVFGSSHDERDSDDSDDPYAYEDDFYEDDPAQSAARQALYEYSFERWKLDYLYEHLHLNLRKSNDLNETHIGFPQLKYFLSQVESGPSMSYSWLLNEDIEGSLSTSEDFVDDFHEEMGVDREVLLNLLGGLWFDLDWEEFDIEDPRFLQNTYIKTLKTVMKETHQNSTKHYALKRIKELFTFNAEDFEAPFRQIPKRFNQFCKQKQWLQAMVEWSLYATYRKVFKTHSSITAIKKTTPALPLMHAFNGEEYVKSRLDQAYQRVQKYYKKVYPHEDTSTVVYGSPDQGRATLTITTELQKLRSIGEAYEAKRPSKAKAANVFVPMLYLIVSSSSIAHVDDSCKKRFVPVPLILTGEKRTITRKETTLVFKDTHDSDNYYFKRATDDVVRGRILQGTGEEEARSDIQTLMTPGVNRDSQLIHSERVLIEASRDSDYVKSLVHRLLKDIESKGDHGNFGVYGALMLAYSTNTVCSKCTPSLIALQNSGEEIGGFLNLLTHHLRSIKGAITFSTAGFDARAQTTNWGQFCLNTIVTASVNFDEQAHDLTEEGQFKSNKIKKPSKDNHNPHAKLYFMDDTIDLTPREDDETPVSFFYEFVGKDMHRSTAANDNHEARRHRGAVFASGSHSWLVD